MTLAVELAGLREVGGLLPGSVASARARWDERRGLWLTLRASALVGVGEAAPLPGHSPDTLAGCADALARALARPIALAVAEPWPAIADALARIDRSLPAARFALETALLDLVARARGSAVAALLGPGRAALAASVVLGDDPLVEAAAARAAGITTFKRKVRAPERDRAVLDEVRAAHPDARLRLDANGAWSRAEAGAALALFAPLRPEHVEQPVSPGQLAGLASPLPLAADESAVADDADFARALAAGELVAVVLKPALLGGLGAAAALAVRVRRAGAAPIVSHLFDGPIALAACCELAVALGSDRAAGLGPHGGLAGFPPRSVPQLGGGVIRSYGPGLGVAP